MAPSPINLVPTYFVDYEGPMGTRSFQMRTAATMTDAQALTSINGFLDQVDQFIYSSVTFTGVRKRAVGANVSLPVAGWVSRSGLVAGTLDPTNYPRFIQWVGRSTAGAGRRVRVSLYGANLAIEGDYRLEADDLAGAVGATALFLTTESAAGRWRTIDGNTAQWYLYANVGYNAYYQRRARRTA